MFLQQYDSVIKKVPEHVHGPGRFMILWSRAFAFICCLLRRFRGRWRQQDGTQRTRGTNKVIAAVEVCSAVTRRRNPGGPRSGGPTTAGFIIKLRSVLKS